MINNKESHMSEHDPMVVVPASPRNRTPRMKGALTVVAIVLGVAAIGAFAGSSFSQGLRHSLVTVPDTMATDVSFEGRFGDFGPGWASALPSSVIEAFIDMRADRMIRHLAVEIDATADQQDKLRAIVRSTVKDLLPVRDKMLAARATGRELLTRPTIDRAALESLRADQIATHEAVSKQLVQAVADAADVLTPEQRRKISDMLPAGGGWGMDRGPGPRWGWGGFWRH
jgi:Spy/CpxP family protein refolding chaperone